MPKQPSAKKHEGLFLAISFFVLALLLGLSFLNIKSFYDANQKQKGVLGAETSLNAEKDYWVNFLGGEKDYLPGWIELAKIDKELGDTNGYDNAIENIKRINPNTQELASLGAK